MENKKLKVQLITEEGKWPYVGNAFRNRDGSITLYLDEGVTVTAGQKLYLRPARTKNDAGDKASAEAAG